MNDNLDPNVTDLSRFDLAWKKNDGHIDYVKAARARGVTTWFVSPLTLEPWMTEANPAEYVEWAMAILRRWRDQGVEMPYYSILNEPGYVRSGNRSGPWMRDVIKLLGARLGAEGFNTKIVAPDDLNATQAYRRLQTILADPGAAKYVGAIAYHLYGNGDRAKVKQLAEQYQIPVWMTEFYHHGWMEWAKIMQTMIGTYDATAVDYLWGYFGQVSTNGGQLITIRHTGNSYTGFDLNKQYFVMGQYSRFVRPGAKRIDATSSDPRLSVTAYVSGPEVIAVAINDSPLSSTVGFELGAGAPRISSVQSITTSATENWRVSAATAITGSRFVVTLPASSITTVVAK